LVSREVKFLIGAGRIAKFNSTALAEHLLFGYPLGERTLWEGIRRLGPANMLLMDSKKKSLLSRTALSWNLDHTDKNSTVAKNLHAKAKELSDLFLTSCREIVQAFPRSVHVVSLSGGLDSRATLAGVIQAGTQPVAYSFSSAESKIAMKIARTLGVNHNVIHPSFGISKEDYVRLTDGLVDLSLIHVMSYLCNLRENVGNKAVLITGDGGDKTLGSLYLEPKVRDVGNLLQHIISTDRILEIDEICSLLSIDKDAFREHLRNHLLKYPEKTIAGKFSHFKVFERGLKWLFVGEDRNRYFLWSTTPFYSVRFFSASMEVCQNAKKHYMLYKNFLSDLDPALNRIKYHNRMVSLSFPNWLLRLYLVAFDWLKEHFYEPGAANPLALSSRKQVHEELEEARRSALRLIEGDALQFVSKPRALELVKNTQNIAKINALATLILYAHIALDRNPCAQCCS
jgi:asparagine synthase (glutamine-hydrolysing)